MKQNEILDDELFIDKEAFADVSDEKGKTLSNSIKRLGNIIDEIDAAEKHLKALKTEKRRLEFEAIPEVMDEMGVERVDVGDATVSLKSFVSASIPVDRREEAFNWLRERNLDDIIKNDVIISFGRGQDNIAGDLMVDLERRGLHPESKTHIHSMTLKSFIRERVEKGLETNLDLFGAFVARTAEIKPKRRK
jgi:hypothetical protein|tara:strand:- start:1289 stop:1864 length:576 start_codon:yes stop_codon:yes gene_type:complete